MQHFFPPVIQANVFMPTELSSAKCIAAPSQMYCVYKCITAPSRAKWITCSATMLTLQTCNEPNSTGVEQSLADYIIQVSEETNDTQIVLPDKFFCLHFHSSLSEYSLNLKINFETQTKCKSIQTAVCKRRCINFFIAMHYVVFILWKRCISRVFWFLCIWKILSFLKLFAGVSIVWWCTNIPVFYRLSCE